MAIEYNLTTFYVIVLCFTITIIEKNNTKIYFVCYFRIYYHVHIVLEQCVIKIALTMVNDETVECHRTSG